MLEDKDPSEIIEIAEIAENQGVDIETAEKVKELMLLRSILTGQA